MRIVHLGKYYPPYLGGIETHVQALARGQAQLGHEVRVLCVRHERGLTQVENDQGVEVVRLRRAMHLAKLDVCPEAGMALREAADSSDVVHLHAPNPLFTLALWRARAKAPLVVTHHCDVVRQRARAWALRPFERWAYSRALTIMPTSPSYAGGSKSLRPFGGKLRVLPHGIDLHSYVNPSSEALRLAEDVRRSVPGPIWMGCGRFVYYKGFLDAVRALPHCEGTLVLVGDGPERPRLEAEAKKLGVEGRLVFTGALKHAHDLVPYYLASDAFWFPSCARTEAFGLAQVEAMACGRPVINANVPHSGVTWVSPHEETGLTVPVHDPKALASAARRLAGDPALRERLGRAARARAVAMFDHRVMAQESLKAYAEALRRGRPGHGAPVALAPPLPFPQPVGPRAS